MNQAFRWNWESVYPAPAKINLFLHVNGRRPDGYHELRTLFHTIDLADQIEIERAGAGVELEVAGSDLTPGPANLARRAAESFLAQWGERGFPFIAHAACVAFALLSLGSGADLALEFFDAWVHGACMVSPAEIAGCQEPTPALCETRFVSIMSPGDSTR